MRFQTSSRSRIALRLAAAAAALFAVTIATSSRAASTGQPNLAYDEVMKFVRGDQPTPVPGTFSADFQAALNASSPAPQHHGMFGNLLNSVDQMKGAMSIFTTGMATRHYYLNGWDRTDEVATQQATIDRPDRHQIIYLDLAKKTYRLVDTNTTHVTETPPPYQPPAAQGPQPSPQPGTGKLDITVSSSALGPMTIEGVGTNGYAQDFKMSETQSTGSCKDGSFETAMTEYLSSYPEPHIIPPNSPVHMPKMTMPTIPSSAMMGVHPGCNPTMSMHASTGASPPGDQLAMWMLVELKGAAQSTQGRQGGSFATLIERGNVHTLGSSDAGLFDIPAGFTQEASQ